MDAKFTVELIKGPTVGGSDRGVRFMEMGQIHLARFTREHADYNDSDPRKRRTSPLEGYQSGTWIYDPGSATTIPWTFKDTDHYLRPANDDPIHDTDFKTLDGPSNLLTDMMVYNGDTVDVSQLYMEHAVFFAVRTVQNINNSADVYVQRLRLNWHVNGDGTVNNTTGVWTYSGAGASVGGDAAWGAVQDGTQVPHPATNDIMNDLLNTINMTWVPSDQ